jgi:hypothetical protein
MRVAESGARGAAEPGLRQLHEEHADDDPEAELRRLLKLLGGADPAALQRAAATFTETFCAVPQAEASVAALRPLALATQPCEEDR